MIPDDDDPEEVERQRYLDHLRGDRQIVVGMAVFTFLVGVYVLVAWALR